MAGRLFVTRQEVLFFDVKPAETAGLPVWADMPFYGFPAWPGGGFKVARDRHGPRIAEMDDVARTVGEDTAAQARDFLARRFPALAGRPVVQGRVCQYANSSNGDFLVDRHPGLDNVWLVGCGSGHGFKHGPAVGRHAAELVRGHASPMDRLGLATKRTEQARTIQ
jgi:glycine/D-amino acid oxidase-like deaminating enzyme